MVKNVTLLALPTEVQRLIIYFLGPKDALRYVAASAFLTATLPQHVEAHAAPCSPCLDSFAWKRSSRMWQCSYHRTVVLEKEWWRRHGSEAALGKWLQLIGPVCHARFETSLTCGLAHPHTLHHLLQHLAPWLRAATVNIQGHAVSEFSGRGESNADGRTFNANAVTSTAFLNTLDLVDQEIANQTTSTLSHSEAPALSQLGHICITGQPPKRWMIPYRESQQIVQWMDYLLKHVAPSSLVSLCIRLDVAYLRAFLRISEDHHPTHPPRYNVRQLHSRYARLTHLKNLTLEILADDVSKLSQGLCYSLTGFRAVLSHQHLFHFFLQPFLAGKHVKQLYVKVALPEALTALRALFEALPSETKSLTTIAIELQSIPPQRSTRTAVAEEMLNRLGNSALHELKETMRMLGFFASNVTKTFTLFSNISINCF